MIFRGAKKAQDDAIEAAHRTAMTAVAQVEDPAVKARRTYAERTAELEAELQAIEPPRERYRITKDFTNGSFTVERWGKRIEGGGTITLALYGIPSIDWRHVRAGYDVLQTGLPSLKAAEGWLKAYFDPTTNRTSYDAEGNRIEVES